MPCAKANKGEETPESTAKKQTHKKQLEILRSNKVAKKRKKEKKTSELIAVTTRCPTHKQTNKRKH